MSGIMDGQALYERRRAAIARRDKKRESLMASRNQDKHLKALMKRVDYGDLDKMTPTQAAVAESTVVLTDCFGDDYAVQTWSHVRGVAFALEAFNEYCHLTRWPSVSWAQLHPSLLDRMAMARRMLDCLRAAPDDEYAQALAVAERLRVQHRDQHIDGNAFVRTLTTFLFTERSDWFEQDLAAAGRGDLPAAALLPSVTTADHAGRVGELLQAGPKWKWNGDPDIEAAFLRVAGDRALPFLLAWYDGQPDHRQGQGLSEPGKRALDAISRMPGDAALRALADRGDAGPELLAYLYTAAMSFPDSALRVLSAMEPTPALVRILAAVVSAAPEQVYSLLPELAAEPRKRVEALIAEGTPSPEVLSQLPVFLLRPPWSDPKAKRPKPVVLQGLAAPDDVRIAWLPGERERWLGRGAGWEPHQGWAAVAEQVDAWRAKPLDPDDPMVPVALYFAAYGPPELVRPMLLDGWQPPVRRADDRARAFVARYELLALPAVRAIRGLPAVRGRLLQPFVSADIAAAMVEGMTRQRSVARGAALGWLRRHAEPAVRCLLPAALGKAGPARRNADAALRRLAAEDTDVVGIAKAAHGPDAASALEKLLTDGGLGTYPRVMPEVPIWARTHALPGIRLKDGTATLPARATLTVVEMLQISKPEAPYPGLDIVKEVCDEASLGEFAFALFENWRETGSDPARRWAFDAVGHLGDDRCVDRLAALIGPWTTGRNHTLVSDALTVLGMIGGDHALAALHAVVAKGRRSSVRRRAERQFLDVAASLDLDADDLADRVVPTLGLGADGTLRLDYGPRLFHLGFDESLRPRITDETGKVLPRMPRPVKTDDPELAKAAYQQFTEVRKAAEMLAADQIKRLEKALFTRRRWQPEGFATHLAGHPLLRPVIRRLVWGVYGPDGSPIGSFRIAEDLSYADVHDARYELPEGATIGVAHPLDLGTALDGWREVFADYEILQPLDQLTRPTLTLTEAERAGRTLERYERFVLDPAELTALEPRGWYSGPVGDPPVWSRFLRPLGEDDRYLILDVTPGLQGGVAAGSGWQTIERIWLSAAGAHASFELHAVPLSELDAVPASEILRDLIEVAGR